MSENPQTGQTELAAGQSQPEVPVNAGLRGISAMIAGEIEIDFASDANYTLVANDPADDTDEWPFNVIRFTDTGVVLTGGVDVIYPDLDTLYGGPARPMFIFDNQTAETLTLKRLGETGVAVLAGDRALVFHDGTDLVEIVNPI